MNANGRDCTEEVLSSQFKRIWGSGPVAALAFIRQVQNSKMKSTWGYHGNKGEALE
jgi:hypothetical protein